MTNVPFDLVATADLVVDQVYEGGTAGHAGDDPINRMFRVGNSGGFRWRGTLQSVELLVLYTTGSEPDWPDRLDLSDGTFAYYGDNRHPGKELHDTSKKGNQLLKQMFEQSLSAEGRTLVPPIFLLEKSGRGRDVLFRGLLVPGAPSVPVDEQLVAVWRSAKGSRFQNYRATFSVLDDSPISRAGWTAFWPVTPMGPKFRPSGSLGSGPECLGAYELSGQSIFGVGRSSCRSPMQTFACFVMCISILRPIHTSSKALRLIFGAHSRRRRTTILR